MEPNAMPQGNEQIVEQILSAVEQLLQAAGPEWALEFIMAGIEQAGQGGEPEMISGGGPGAMPPMRPGAQRPRNALSGQ